MHMVENKLQYIYTNGFNTNLFEIFYLFAETEMFQFSKYLL